MTQGSIREERPDGSVEPFGSARYSVFKGVHVTLKQGGTADEIRPCT